MSEIVVVIGRTLKEDWCPLIQDLAANWGIRILPLETIQTSVSWAPREMSWIKLNSDGSLSADRADYGVALRNCNGKLLLASAVQDKALSSINVLEFRAIVQGLKLAHSLGIPRVYIESDSSTVIAWVRGKGCLLWRAFRDHTELKAILPGFLEWKISHIPREGNQVADLLAARRDSPGCSMVFPESI
ncbi:hypothetical protein QJS10_CPA06g01319 [Acorus calamus]|uniref:RNase H type-1 domain-containing protein n=1 Tax=Acorus calamus TaxID=4465 RepID=A0AAV9ENG3_ACOCL|nr:hypothetical protein QJS10_CPA06g01319 [Acorus calamus]